MLSLCPWFSLWSMVYDGASGPLSLFLRTQAVQSNRIADLVSRQLGNAHLRPF